MANLKDIVAKTNEKFKVAQDRRNSKLTSRRATKDNLITYFRQMMLAKGFGYGQLDTLTQQDRNMLGGTLLLFKKNEWEDSEIFKFFRDVVEYWPRLSKMDTLTMRGKAWPLGARPSLRDIVICRQSIMTNLGVLISDDTEAETAYSYGFDGEVEGSENLVKEPRSRTREKIGPTQRDLDDEFSKLYDE